MNSNGFDVFRSTIRALLLVGVVTALPVGTTNADVLFNAEPENTTGNVADDYHIKMIAQEPITVNSTFESGGDVSFNDALSGGGVQGDGTTAVTINWSGATVNQNQSAHVGAATAIGGGTPNGLEIVESWWTFGGAKLVSATSGRLASAEFNGTAGTGDWVVVKIELFDDAVGTNLIATEWVEGRGNDAVISNSNPGGAVYARWAFNTPSATMTPIEDLDESLSGFGPFTTITELPGRGVLPAITGLGFFVLAVLLLTSVTIAVWRRRRTASPATTA